LGKLLRNTLVWIVGLMALALILGSAGVALLWGAGWTCLFISAWLAAAAVVLIRGASAGG
jgi:hypothetical protein